jgi:hypothetical protein
MIIFGKGCTLLPLTLPAYWLLAKSFEQNHHIKGATLFHFPFQQLSPNGHRPKSVQMSIEGRVINFYNVHTTSSSFAG